MNAIFVARNSDLQVDSHYIVLKEMNRSATSVENHFVVNMISNFIVILI